MYSQGDHLEEAICRSSNCIIFSGVAVQWRPSKSLDSSVLALDPSLKEFNLSLTCIILQ